MSLRIAIVGRPNVGKSTLFNRLTGRKRAIVDPEPGVTRDTLEASGRIGDLRFVVLDTAGLDEGDDHSLEGRLRHQTLAALEDADLALFLIDAKVGVTALDGLVAGWLRPTSTPVVLLANKCEGLAAEAFMSEAWGLGFDAPVPISAQNGDGLALLAEALQPHLEAAATDSLEHQGEPPIRLAIVGRPNAGKSSLANALLGDERLLTGPEPGLTRDAVPVFLEADGRRIELIDTAGLRKKSRVDGSGLETLATKSSLATVRAADVVLLVVDATTPFERQDLVIANRALDAGRALGLVVNKWDLIEDHGALSRFIREQVAMKLPQVQGLRWLPVSAVTGKNVERILPAVIDHYERWSTRIPTAPLNRWLEEARDAHPPPLHRGRRTKIRYATQVETRPPTFLLFANQAEGLPESYLRYLGNGLRRTFELDGIQLRMRVRVGDNPYA